MFSSCHLVKEMRNCDLSSEFVIMWEFASSLALTDSFHSIFIKNPVKCVSIRKLIVWSDENAGCLSDILICSLESKDDRSSIVTVTGHIPVSLLLIL